MPARAARQGQTINNGRFVFANFTSIALAFSNTEQTPVKQSMPCVAERRPALDLTRVYVGSLSLQHQHASSLEELKNILEQRTAVDNTRGDVAHMGFVIHEFTSCLSSVPCLEFRHNQRTYVTRSHALVAAVW